MAGALQSIRIASKRSGLSTHVIRVWEKRYGAVTPQRTGTNRRLYSGDEIERLTLLRLVTAAGHTISNVAQLSTPELRSLAETEASAPLADRANPTPAGGTGGELLVPVGRRAKWAEPQSDTPTAARSHLAWSGLSPSGRTTRNPAGRSSADCSNPVRVRARHPC